MEKAKRGLRAANEGVKKDLVRVAVPVAEVGGQLQEEAREDER